MSSVMLLIRPTQVGFLGFKQTQGRRGKAFVHDADALPTQLNDTPYALIFAEHCDLLFLFFISEMCQILIVLSLNSVQFLEMHRDVAAPPWVVGRATHPLPHPCKRCMILLSLSLMKSHKPPPFPFSP